MFTKKSIFLIVVPALISLPVGIVQANDIEVQTGDLRVSVGDGKVEVIPSNQVEESPSFLRRFPSWNIFRSRIPIPPASVKCTGNNYSYQSTQTSSSGTGITRSSSSTSTTTCN
jgi:hypothetical protein